MKTQKVQQQSMIKSQEWILTQAGQLVTTLQEWVLSQMRKRMIVSKLAGQAKSIDQPCKKAMWRRPKAI